LSRLQYGHHRASLTVTFHCRAETSGAEMPVPKCPSAETVSAETVSAETVSAETVSAETVSAETVAPKRQRRNVLLRERRHLFRATTKSATCHVGDRG